MKLATGIIDTSDFDLINMHRNIMRILEKGGSNQFIADQIILGVQIELAQAVNKKFDKDEDDVDTE